MTNNEKLKSKAEILNQKLRNASQKTVPPNLQEENETEILKKKVEDLMQENRKIKTLSSLNKFGCLKSELVAKEIPNDCENIDEWVQNYKNENAFLFSLSQENHGGNFKPSRSNNLSPTELMNNFIRGI